MDLTFWIKNSESFSHQIFMIVMGALFVSGKILGISYKAVNILVYFFLIPSSYIYIISRKTSKFLNVLLLLPVIYFISLDNKVGALNSLFDKSVVFLEVFASYFSSNYINVSVYLCVYLVAFVYLVLVALCYSRKIFITTMVVLSVLLFFYFIIIFPNFKTLLLHSIPKG
jgi:hypothetical protein